MKTELDRFQQDGDNATARHLILLATFRLVIAVLRSDFLLALLGIELGAGRFLLGVGHEAVKYPP